MAEHFHRLIAEEEAFLDEFQGPAVEASALMGDEWRPLWGGNDKARRNQAYFRASGELTELRFESASVFHSDGGFSSVQIVLRSSVREVTIRVRRTDDGNPLAEIVVDRARP